MILDSKTLQKNPLITVIVPVYNRELVIERAVKSISGQSYKNIEILIIDDGSTDNTIDLLCKIKDNRIRIIRHDTNKGVAAAKNTGLDNISGEWFFIADSDDELLPGALESLIRVPLYLDNDISHITCNIIDYGSKVFLGKGFVNDQYWDEQTIYTQTKGEFKGLIKTEILGKDRLNDKITGWEEILWTKIRSRSKGYYIHQGLYIVHKEGDDRICKQISEFDREKKVHEFSEIKDDSLYWQLIEKVDQKRFIKQCIHGMILPMSVNNKNIARDYAAKISQSNVSFRYKFFSKVIMHGGPFLSSLILYANELKKHYFARDAAL